MTPEQIAELLQLASVLREGHRSPFWQVLTQQIQAVEASLTEQLVQATPEDHDLLRGEILGIRRVLSFPANVIRTADQIRDAQSKEQ